MSYIAPTETVSSTDNLSWAQKRYRSRRDSGLCVTCDNNSEPGKSSCKPCLVIKAKLMKARTHERKAKRLCVYGTCRIPPVEGKTLCEDHLEDMRIRAKNRSRDRRARGLCVGCNGPSPYGQARCPDCRKVKTDKPPAPVLREMKNKLLEEKQREDRVNKQHRLEFLIKYLDCILDQRAKEIALKRFWEELTLEEISKDYGITRERVRQIECKAIKQLAHRVFTTNDTDIPIKKVKVHCNWLRNSVQFPTHAA